MLGEVESSGPTLLGEVESPSTKVLVGWSGGKKDEKEHSEPTRDGPTEIGPESPGPTVLGDMEEEVNVGWNRKEKKKRN